MTGVIKVSELPGAGALTGGELFLGVQDGESVKIEARAMGDIPALVNRVIEAGVHADAAEAARDAALIQAGVYADEPTGRAAVADGQAFKVQGSGDVAAYEYRRINAGASVLLATYPSAAAAGRVATAGSAPFQVAITDEDGFIAAKLGADGIELAALALGNAAASGVLDAGIRIQDAEGFWVEIVDKDGQLPLADDGDADLIADLSLYGARNSRNLASTTALANSVNTVVAAPAWDYSHVIGYGQSLSTGWESWPALSTTVQYESNVMVGGAVRPATEGGATFTPTGGSSAFQPMVACVTDYATLQVLTPEQVAALPAGNGSRGETPMEGAVNFAKRMHNLRAGVLDDPSRVFIASTVGVGGAIIEMLSKGATPQLWDRVTGVVQAARSNADAVSKSYGISAFVWIQGEFNYTDHGGVMTKAEYKTKLAQLWSDFKADCVTGIAGQVIPPAFITYQTGGAYTSDTYDMAIGMAQWEFCRENAGCYLATPVYPYTDKGGHLDANGSRWFGNQLGKVMHRITEMRQNWKPLSPLGAKITGRVVSIDFHVPEPPLVFDTPYVVNTATDYPAKGFTVLDSSGVVPIASIRIVLDTIVEITCSRDIVGAVTVRYADKTYHNGNGCLRDSDVTVANDQYVYTEGTGHYAAANIAALVGKPYPLWNWCIAFSIPAN